MKVIYESIEKYVRPGTRIVLGLSGGPDSVALLHLLLDYREALDLELVACHLHHQLRDEADLDLEFVRKLCHDVKIPLHERKIDVADYARVKGLSIEEAGRELRYLFYRELASRKDLIALGHHKSDQVETMLMRLMRGTGIHGLGGMRILEGQLFRPLLQVNKSDILNYLHYHGYEYCIDHTNFESIYGRNKVRLELVPLMETFNPSLEDGLYELSIEAQETQDYFEDLIDSLMPTMVQKSEGRSVLSIPKLSKLMPIVRKKLFHRALCEFYGSSQNITRDYVFKMERLLTDRSGTEYTIRENVLIRRDFNDIIIEYPGEDCDLSEKTLSLGENTWGAYRITVEKVDEVTTSDDALYFQAEELGELSVRSRRPGDRVLMFYSEGHKKLKDILIEKKIDKNYRDSIPIICRDGNILSVLGLFRSGYNLIDDENHPIYRISFEVK